MNSGGFSNVPGGIIPTSGMGAGINSIVQAAVNAVNGPRSTPSATLPTGNNGTIGGVQPPAAPTLPTGNDGTIGRRETTEEELAKLRASETSRLGGV